MTALALPELIEPGELYIPDGKTGFETVAGGLPNGDDAFRIVEATGTEDFMAYQDSIPAGTSGRAPHLLDDGACALSFWIRRNQDFDSHSSAFGNNTTSTAPIQSAHRFIMGVCDPLAASLPAPSSRTLSWAFLTSALGSIQFVILGFRNNTEYRWLTSGQIALPTGQWSLVVVNRDAADFSSNVSLSPKGAAATFLNGNANESFAADTLWKLFPNPVNNQRFCIGDGTTLQRTAGGASSGAAWDIAKVCFHDQNLSAVEQLDMIESMRYGT
jgi:hypothetical protein